MNGKLQHKLILQRFVVGKLIFPAATNLNKTCGFSFLLMDGKLTTGWGFLWGWGWRRRCVGAELWLTNNQLLVKFQSQCVCVCVYVWWRRDEVPGMLRVYWGEGQGAEITSKEWKYGNWVRRKLNQGESVQSVFTIISSGKANEGKATFFCKENLAMNNDDAFFFFLFLNFLLPHS